MTIKLPHNFPNVPSNRSSASTPKARLARFRKPVQTRAFSALGLGQGCPSHCPPQRGAFLREQGPNAGPSGARLGRPLDIREAAELIGCSPWTVRQTLIPRGLPYFRFKASGRLTFYEGQVIRWIETQQQGGKTTQ